MKIIGLTGGIGSGKSLVANYLAQKGVPVYNSDLRAKQLMNFSVDLKQKIIELLGENAYQNNELNRAYIGEKVFNNVELLQKLNTIVHPIMRKDFEDWVENYKKNNHKFCIKEAAILFESGAYKNCNYIVVVTADEKIRTQRVMKRDSITKEQILQRMKQQMSEQEKISKADYVINNSSSIENLYLEAEKLYKLLNQ